MYKLHNFEDVSVTQIYRAHRFCRLLPKLEGPVNQPWGNVAPCVLVTGRTPKSPGHSPAAAHSQVAAGGSRWRSALQRACLPGQGTFQLCKARAHPPCEEARSSVCREPGAVCPHPGTPRSESTSQVCRVSFCAGSLHPIKRGPWAANGRHICSDVRLI